MRAQVTAWSALLVALALVGGQARQRVTEGHLEMDDEVRLWHRTVGEGPETVIVPVVVLTSPHFDSLAEGGRRIVYYDPRGRGRSDTGAIKDLSVRRGVRDLERLRQHLGADRVALVGYSWYALEFAQYALDYPARVTRLVQLAPVPPRLSAMGSRNSAFRARVDKSAWAEYERLRNSPPSDPRERCRAYQRAIAPAVSVHPERLDHETVCAHPTEWPENQAPVWETLMRSAQSVDLRPRLAALAVPRLIVRPDRDLIPAEGVREWLTGTQVRLLTVPDADHAVYLDRPDVVIPAIETFLSGEWPAGAAD